MLQGCVVTFLDITIYDVYFILLLGVFLYRELGDLHPHQVVRSEYEDLQRSGNATFEKLTDGWIFFMVW